MSRSLPMVTLVLLAPVIADLLAGTFPIWNAAPLVFAVPIYGGGALDSSV